MVQARQGKNIWIAVLLISGLALGGVLGWLIAYSGGRPRATSKLESLKFKPLAEPPAAGASRFIAFGDWGAGTPGQKAVAAQTARLFDQAPFQSAVLLGDNIYEVGDVRKLGKAYFTDMYAPLLKGGVRFIVALGNHDVVGGHQADQLSFFNMPAYYYTVQQGNIEFFVLNTNTFAGDQLQQQWLNQALAKSGADWKIVVGHHPVYSSGDHGLNAQLKKTLSPLLEKNHATVYLAGHDHDYERFQEFNGVGYIVSGGGGAYLRDFKKPLPGSLVRLKKHHFLSFESTPTALKMRVYDSTGALMDEYAWKLHAQRAENISWNGKF